MNIKAAAVQAYGATTKISPALESGGNNAVANGPPTNIESAVSADSNLATHVLPANSIITAQEQFVIDLMFGTENTSLYAGRISDQIKVGLLTDVKA